MFTLSLYQRVLLWLLKLYLCSITLLDHIITLALKCSWGCSDDIGEQIEFIQRCMNKKEIKSNKVQSCLFNQMGFLRCPVKS